MSRLIRTLADLERAATSGLASLYPEGLKILVGSASCGIAMGAREIEAAARHTVKELGMNATVTRTGCIGFCAREPLLDLVLPNGPRISYAEMTPEKTGDLLSSYASDGEVSANSALGRFEYEEHVLTGEVHKYPPGLKDLGKIPKWGDLDFYRRQKKIILRNCGSIDPMVIEEAIARGTYRGALLALTGKKPEEVIDLIRASGLRGRGGAAFPTGLKWRLTREAKGETKYIICNADEGAPGASMDRSVLEGDPHAILEGMIIGSYAIGAREGFIYVRREYPLAITTLQHAIAEAENRGLLGDNIFGTGWSFRVKIRRGAGAYICGEETALIESIEGHSGEPRNRPPYPVTRGLFGEPTVVNNVKTWASVAPIVVRGADWYAGMGTESASGTTVFSLEGAVKNAGLVEVPFGVTLREMVYEIGGGIVGDRPLKAVQAGGPSRGCLPPSVLDTPIDLEDGPEARAMTGTGGIIVLDESACMVDMARFLLGFFVEESCGKCAPCREGTKHMYRTLTRICRGEGTLGDLEQLKRLATAVEAASMCGLGRSAPNPVLTALRHFRDEFEAHIKEKKCLAGVCPLQAVVAEPSVARVATSSTERERG
jgi:NADH:ubiquinone oxidoreductase subunit F (NADH-binding)/(2Fe-2S) ferredoxin